MSWTASRSRIAFLVTASANTSQKPSTRLVLLTLAVGLMVMYGPVLVTLTTGLWATDDYAYGPLLLGVSIWLTWKKRRELELTMTGLAVPGWALVILGVVIFAFGYSQDILLFSIGSLIPLLAGLLLIFFGVPGLRALWFPLLFLVFVIPLPQAIIDALTGPLKQAVSVVAETILYEAGYPVGRMGVMLVIGQYQLLVADACSGLSSILSLSAIGLLYLHVMQYRDPIRIVLVGMAIIPAAFIANVIRVMALVLVTYHYGDAVGQGFVHDFAGLLLFVVSVVGLVCADLFIGTSIKLIERRLLA